MHYIIYGCKKVLLQAKSKTADVTNLGNNSICKCTNPKDMLRVIIFILFVIVWWYFAFKDKDRDIVAWRQKKYGKAVFYFIMDNFVKVLIMSFLFPFVALFLLMKLFSD